MKKLIILLAIILVISFSALVHFRTDFRVKDIPEFFRTLDFDIYLFFVINLFALTIIFNLSYLVTKLSKLKIQNSRIWNIFTLLILNALVLIISVAIMYLAYVKKHPDYSYTYPKLEASLPNYDKPIEVKFNVPVRIEKLKASIVPEIKGEWVWEPYLGVEGITRKGQFIIEETPLPGERFVAYVAGINKLTDKKEHEYGFIFYSVPVPNISKSLPEKDQEDVPVDSEFKFEFDRKYTDLMDVEYSILPEVGMIPTESSNHIISFKPTSNLNQNAEYTITLKYRTKTVNLKTKETINLAEASTEEVFKFKTPKEPLVSEITPSGDSAKPTDFIQMKFEAKMNKENLLANLKIEPEIDADVEWVDDVTLKITPKQPLPKDTAYKITINKGTKSQMGGVLMNDYVHEFRTLGKVQASLAGPNDGEWNINEFAEIHIQFNQEVDKQSVAERLYIDPGVPGDITWIENKLIYKPTAKLQLETFYKVKVAAGVKSIDGIDSDRDFEFSFKTRSDTYAFNIPIYYQQTGFSCNIYTAIMIMAWKGVYADATSIISEIGYNDSRSGDSWVGNPYREYVGTYNGGWGYGTYWPTIKNVLGNRGIATEPKVGWDVASLTRTVEQGHPVIVWRYNGVGGGQNISWTAWDGTYVNAFNGMHGSIVTGFKGPASDPTAIYIHDPWLGRLWLDRWTFDAYWSYSGRMALIVY